MKVNYDNKRRDLEIKREFLFIGIKSNKMSFMYNCRLYEKVVVGLCTHLPKAGRPRPVTSVEQHPHPHLTRQGALAGWQHSCACYDRCLPAAHLQGSLKEVKILLLVHLSSVACTLPPYTEGFASCFVTLPQVFTLFSFLEEKKSQVLC